MSNDCIRLANDHPFLSDISDTFTKEERKLCVNYETGKYLRMFNMNMNKVKYI